MKKVIKAVMSVAVLATMLLAMSVAVMAAGPATVTTFTQTGAGTTSVSFQWDAVLGEDVYYEVSMSTDGVNFAVVEDRQSSNTYYESNLIAGKTYYVKVRTMYYDYSSDPVYGEYSNAFTVITMPEEVTGLKQTSATTNSITIAWTASAGATAYEVCKEVNSNEYILGTTTSTTYTVTGLNNTVENEAAIYVRPVRTVGSYTAKDDSTSSYSYARISKYDVILVPTKVQNVHIANYWNSLKEVNLGYDKTVHSDGYEYELYDNKGKLVSSATLSSYINNVNENIFYKVRVRSYVTIDNKLFNGEWSDYEYFSFQPELSLKRTGKKYKVSWKKVKGATNYTVYMSTNKDAGYKKVATTKKAKVTIKKFKKKKLKKNKTYYFYVVANKKVGKKVYKSEADTCYYLY